MAFTYDNNKANGARGNQAPKDLTITIPAGSDLLVLTIAVGSTSTRAGGAPTCGTVDPYNAYTFTIADQVRGPGSGEGNVELWYLINPPSGSVTIRVPNTGTARYLTLEAASWTTTTPPTLRAASGNTIATGANPTTPALTVAIGDLLVAVCLHDDNSWGPTARTWNSPI